VAAQLAASQEGPSSVELVITYAYEEAVLNNLINKYNTSICMSIILYVVLIQCV
jgi:hypothetical protein